MQILGRAVLPDSSPPSYLSQSRPVTRDQKRALRCAERSAYRQRMRCPPGRGRGHDVQNCSIIVRRRVSLHFEGHFYILGQNWMLSRTRQASHSFVLKTTAVEATEDDRSMSLARRSFTPNVPELLAVSIGPVGASWMLVPVLQGATVFLFADTIPDLDGFLFIQGTGQGEKFKTLDIGWIRYDRKWYEYLVLMIFYFDFWFRMIQSEAFVIQ
jgi:hypothetical protein